MIQGGEETKAKRRMRLGFVCQKAMTKIVVPINGNKLIIPCQVRAVASTVSPTNSHDIQRLCLEGLTL